MNVTRCARAQGRERKVMAVKCQIARFKIQIKRFAFALVWFGFVDLILI